MVDTDCTGLNALATRVCSSTGGTSSLHHAVFAEHGEVSADTLPYRS